MRILIVAALVILLSALLHAPAQADESTSGRWLPFDGPAPSVSLLAADPSRPGRMWAVVVSTTTRASDRSQRSSQGLYRRADAIYTSDDAGASWRPAGNGLPYGEITALSFDHVTSRLYVGLIGGGEDYTRPQGLYCSADDGASWTRVPLGPAFHHIRIIDISRSADSELLYVAAVETTRYPRSFIYLSRDGGGTWEEVQVLEYEQYPGSIAMSLYLDSVNPRQIFLSTYGGLFRSEDNGLSWDNLSIFPCGKGAKRVISVPEPEERGQTVLACALEDSEQPSTVVLQSGDGGLSWSPSPGAILPGSVKALVSLADPSPRLLLSTDGGLFSSSDSGTSWQPLEAAREAVGVSDLLVDASLGQKIYAATGHGVYVSLDYGEQWLHAHMGFPSTGRLSSLQVTSTDPVTIYGTQRWNIAPQGLALASVLRSADGTHWQPLATGSWGDKTIIAASPHDEEHLLLGTSASVMLTRDGGLSWTISEYQRYPVQAFAFDPFDAEVVYVGTYGAGVHRSDDGGLSWYPTGLDFSGVSDLTATSDARIYAATTSYREAHGGLYVSSDQGETWERLTSSETGLDLLSVDLVWSDSGDSANLLIAAPGAGVFRSDDNGVSWTSAQTGLPEDGEVVSFAEGLDGAIWASLAGGGVFRSVDHRRWENVSAGLGDNIVPLLSQGISKTQPVLASTANAGVWFFATDSVSTPAFPESKTVDARIQIVWPHDGASVVEAEQANIGLRLFCSGSLVLPPCDWTPSVEVWQATNTEPASRLGAAEQRSANGNSIPYWELNDVDVSAAQDSQTKLYFMVRVDDIGSQTSIWAHGADPRTYFPIQDTPSGFATTVPDELDARIQIAWPHDGQGLERTVAEADWVNVTVALFASGTELSVPPTWEPEGLTLFGAWNHSVGRPISVEAERRLVQRGALTFPVWDFNNIDVRRARSLENKLYLWVQVQDKITQPTIWAHGVDARTAFPMEDEPISGCGLLLDEYQMNQPDTILDPATMYVGDAANLLDDFMGSVQPLVPDATSGAGLVENDAAAILKQLLYPWSRGLLLQRPADQYEEYLYLSEGPGPVLLARLGERVYLFWPQHGSIWYQWWSDQNEIWQALSSPPSVARSQITGGNWEIGVLGNTLDGEDFVHFAVLRQVRGNGSGDVMVASRWTPIWSWMDADEQSWNGQEGEARLLGTGIGSLELVGPLQDPDVEAPAIFHEAPGYSRQRTTATWTRVGNRYFPGSITLLSTPMTALSQFIAYLREGDLESAGGLADSPDLVETALGFGWSLPREEGEQLLAQGGYLEDEGQPIEFYSSQATDFAFRVYFQSTPDGWSIAAMERLAPVDNE